MLLVSVPYALKAHEAETLGGRTASDFVVANGGELRRECTEQHQYADVDRRH